MSRALQRIETLEESIVQLEEDLKEKDIKSIAEQVNHLRTSTNINTNVLYILTTWFLQFTQNRHFQKSIKEASEILLNQHSEHFQNSSSQYQNQKLANACSTVVSSSQFWHNTIDVAEVLENQENRIDRLEKITNQTGFIQTEKVQEKLTKIQQSNIEKDGDSSDTQTVNGETFNSGSATEAEIATVEEDEPENITQSFKTLSPDTDTIQTTTMTQGTKSTNKPSIFKTVIKAFWPSIPTSKPLATAPKQGKSRGATAKVSKQDMPKEESSMGEGEVNKTEVAQITSDSKVAHPPTRCDNCRTIPCLNNKQIAKQNLVLEKGPFKHGRMYQVSNLKGNLGDTYVTGVVELHPSQPPIFMHYINGNRQTWAEFTEDIKTLKYKCPQRH